MVSSYKLQWLNTLRPRQNGRHFADDVFKCIFLNENVWILLKISLKFVPKGPINNIPSLVQIMAWCRPGDKPLSEPMIVSLLTHICVARPQWVNSSWPGTIFPGQPQGLWEIYIYNIYIIYIICITKLDKWHFAKYKLCFREFTQLQG